MNKLITFSLKVEEQIRIDQVMKITQLAKSYVGKIYLVTKNKHVINTANLPALLTYLLMIKNGQEINIAIDGPYPHLKGNDFKEICSTNTAQKSQRIIQPAMKVKL